MSTSMSMNMRTTDWIACIIAAALGAIAANYARIETLSASPATVAPDAGVR